MNTDKTLEWFFHSHDAIEAAIEDRDFIESIEISAHVIAEIILNGSDVGQVLIAGNGGSAAQAQHFAAELVGRFAMQRGPLPAIALGTDAATLTAIANDFGYENVFERQFSALVHKNTVLVVISTSGRSANILKAVETANRRHTPVIAMTGKPGEPLVERCFAKIVAPAKETALVQQLHLVAIHAMCGIIEKICAMKMMESLACQPSR